ncbi:MAG: SNF2-related protein, partial [Solirubrobacteraceae bacterium]
MKLVPDRAHVELRPERDGDQTVVLSFPYDRALVELCRSIPHRRFDWDTREWSAPATDWAAMKVTEALEHYPDLTPSSEVLEWLANVRRRWIGSVSTTRYDGRGWLVLKTLAGPLPGPLSEGAVEHDGRLLAPLTLQAAQALRAQRSAHLDIAAERCLQIVERGGDPPPARLVYVRGMDGEELRLEVLWDPDIGLAFAQLPGAHGTRSVPLDPWLAEALDAFIARHEVAVTGEAVEVLERLLAAHRDAADAVRRSRATEADAIAETAAVLGGEPTPFQWAAVRYALDARGTFLADEQGLGKTVEALTAIEADGAFPAVVICPASMKLGWERETRRWLPHRSVTVVQGRSAVPSAAEITIVNYEVVAAHHQTLARGRPRALIVDESHYCKNPQAKRTQAVRRLAAVVAPGGLRLA